MKEEDSNTKEPLNNNIIQNESPINEERKGSISSEVGKIKLSHGLDIEIGCFKKESSENIKCIFFIYFIFFVLFSTLIIAIIELILRSKNNYYISNYDLMVCLYLCSAFCVFLFSLFKKQFKNLESFIGFSFICVLWGIPDMVTFQYTIKSDTSISIKDETHKWNFADTLKVIKFSLVIFYFIINIVYFTFCKN